MNTTRLDSLRHDIIRHLVEASPGLSAQIRDWIRRLPLPSADTAAEWVGVLEAVSDVIADRVRAGGNSVQAARSWCEASRLVDDALWLLQDSEKESCECVSGCSACDHRGMTFEDGRAA